MYKVFETLANLPVSTLLEDISNHSFKGGISIVNSETGSGKSLLVPLRIQQDTCEPVLVLQPRRFLAINAAETLSEISGTVLGQEFGYLVGHSGVSEENKFDEDKTEVAFTTYGYALATKVIMEADNIVLDEIHEQSIDMTICKALIKHRYLNGNPPGRLVLMSATLDVEAELEYWKDVAETKVFSAGTGRKFECTRSYLAATPPAAAALSLVDNGRKGILVFAPGMGEIQDIYKEFRDLMKTGQYPNVILSTIHGQSEYSERKAALESPPDGYTKILIGTNVIESGMNLPWVDAGVTTGEKKELYVRPESGAVVLTKVPLAKSNVDQQAGRTNRFQDSEFIICGFKNYDEMKSAPSPEIERLPLTSLYMHCQSVDIDPSELHFMPQPSREKMLDAVDKLKKLGFFDDHLKFTHAGMIAQDLPVGLETAAMLYHAACLGIVADVIPLAAVYEIGSLRKDHSYTHSLYGTSDVLDEVHAYVKAFDIQNNESLSRQNKVVMMQVYNISMRRYIEASFIVKTLEQKLRTTARLDCYRDMTINQREPSTAQIRQCILAGSVCNMGTQSNGRRSDIFRPAGSAYNEYGISNGSASKVYDKTIVCAKLRVITARKTGFKFTVAENITQFETADILAFNDIHPGVFKREVRDDGEYFYVHGELLYYAKSNTYQSENYRLSSKAYDDSGNYMKGVFEAAFKTKNSRRGIW